MATKNVSFKEDRKETIQTNFLLHILKYTYVFIKEYEKEFVLLSRHGLCP